MPTFIILVKAYNDGLIFRCVVTLVLCICSGYNDGLIFRCIVTLVLCIYSGWSHCAPHREEIKATKWRICHVGSTFEHTGGTRTNITINQIDYKYLQRA